MGGQWLPCLFEAKMLRQWYVVHTFFGGEIPRSEPLQPAWFLVAPMRANGQCPFGALSIIPRKLSKIIEKLLNIYQQSRRIRG